MNQPYSLETVPEAMNLAAEHAQQGVIVIDGNKRVHWLNRSAERLIGVQRRKAVGQPLSALAPLHLQDRFVARGRRGRCRLDALLRLPGDLELIRHDGSHQWVSLHSLALPGSGLQMIFLTHVQQRRQSEQHLKMLSLGFDQADAAVLIADAGGIVRHLNRGLRRMLGYSDAELIGQSLHSLFEDGATTLKEALSSPRLDTGQPIRAEARVRDKGGEGIWCEVSASPVAGDNGRTAHLVVLLTEVTQSRIQARLLNRLLEALARDTATTEVMALMCSEVERISPDVLASVIRIDEHGCMRPLAGPSLPAAYLAHIDGVPIGAGRGACGSAAWSGKTVICADIATDPYWEGIRHHALDNGLAACWSTPVLSNDRRVLGTFAFYYRSARQPDPFQRRLVDTCVHLCAVALERDLIRQRVHHLAHHDHLTGLPNRTQLLARAQQALAAAALAGQPLAVLSLHIERFRQVNSELGQDAGDHLLRLTAQRLLAAIGPADVAGRLSGNQFVVVLANAGATQARKAAAHLLQALALPLVVENSTLSPQLGIGVSLYPEHADQVDQLLLQANQARLQAREHGNDNLHFYSEALDAAMQARRALESTLRQGIAGDGSLALHYQPQIHLGNGRVYGAEALARWSHPQHGEITPTHFIPLAEECGLIGELGRWAAGCWPAPAATCSTGSNRAWTSVRFR